LDVANDDGMKERESRAKERRQIFGAINASFSVQ